MIIKIVITEGILHGKFVNEKVFMNDKLML